MKKKSAFLAAAVLSAAAFGFEAYWNGGASGNFNEYANWDVNYTTAPNTYNFNVHVTNAEPVTITCGGSTRIRNIFFSGGNHTLTSGSFMLGRPTATDPQDIYVNVAEGCTVTMPTIVSRNTSEADRAIFHKTGKGTLIVAGGLGLASNISDCHFERLKVDEGTIVFRTGSPNQVCVSGRMDVSAGATVKIETAGAIEDSCFIDLAQGATFDLGGLYDCVGGVTGQGVVTNISTSQQIALCSGPVDFAGKIYGLLLYTPNPKHIADPADAYFRVCSAETLKDAKVRLDVGTNEYANVLRFAPGIGTFDVIQTYFSKPTSIVLEDTDGNPIVYRSKLADQTYDGYFTGKGDFVKTGSSSYTITNAAYSATGRLVQEQGDINIGTGADAALDATAVSNLSEYVTTAGATLNMKNVGDTDWSKVSVHGTGNVHHQGKGVWTIGALSLTNATFTVNSATPANRVVFNGGVSTALTYTVNNPDMQTVINGGEFYLANDINVQGNRTFLQTGGKVDGMLQANGNSCSSEIFYTMTGGELASIVRKVSYPQGVGMDLSGDARVELRDDYGASYTFRLSSAGASHTIRLRDNARLRVQRLLLAGEVSATGLGTLDLQGGVMEVSEWIGMQNGMLDDSPARAEILFDGGVLQNVRTTGKNYTWSAFGDKGHITGKVRAGGARLNTQMSAVDNYIQLSWPFLSDVAEGKDGGFTKTGLGAVILKRMCTVNGPVRVLDGWLKSDSSEAGATFGTGDILLGGMLDFNNARAHAACSDAGAALIYTNAATLIATGGASVTLGAADAAADSVLRRADHGVLFVGTATAGKTLGTHYSVTVNGGVALDADTRLPKAPIFMKHPSTVGNNPRRNGFLTCGADGALMPAAVVAFDPATSTAATVAEITSVMTLNADAAVGALNVECPKIGTATGSSANALTIAEGATLAIGSGNAGSVAPLLMNVTSVDERHIQSIGGGAIDFGAAEGVIAVNDVKSAFFYQFRLDSVIKGTGGVTFASPSINSSTLFRGALALGKVNTYTGGTWIEQVELIVEKAGGLGMGTVHVLGADEGGALVLALGYDGNTFGNALVLSGSGPAHRTHSNYLDALGALTVRKGGISFTGGVELAADAVIAPGCHGSTAPVRFDCAVTGPGKLIVKGPGTLRLAQANSYAGGTVVELGTLEVDDAGTLGTGPVEVKAGATLRFVNAAVKSVPNAISGAGTVECAGAPVVFADDTAFTGRRYGASAFMDGDDFVKTGADDQNLTNALSYAGATTIAEGTLRLGELPPSMLPATDAIALRLDASQEGTVTTDGNGVVLSWADADGRGIAFTNVAALAPSFATAAIGTKPGIRFDGERRRLIANAALPRFRTVFIAARFGAWTHPHGWSNAGFIGTLNEDKGLRAETPGSKLYVKNDSGIYSGGLLYHNGELNMTSYTTWEHVLCANSAVQTVCAVAGRPGENQTLAIGDYFNNATYIRVFQGDFGEFILYDRVLTEDERQAVERYLAAKWGIGTVTVRTVSDVLPKTTDLTVEEGAEFDLNGGGQTVATLNGAGAVVNSSERMATLTLGGGTSVFTGTIAPNIRLEIEPGAVLDLGGGTLHVSVLRKGGQVVNGTITADRIVRIGFAISFQ